MVLNYIWVAFFILAFVVGLARLIFFQDVEVFANIMNSAFDMAKTGFELSLGLTGIMTLWSGMMKIGEEGGVLRIFTRLIGPFFTRIFPEIPKNHPSIGYILMNFAANMLGLDNAATPLGLKAMNSLQEINPQKDTASNAQIMFLVINTSSLALLPITIMVYRKQMGAANPADIFIPILLATFFSTLLGMIAVAIIQKINLLNKVILAYLAGISVMVAALIYYFSFKTPEEIAKISSIVSNFVLFSIIVSFIALAVRKRINVYETFIEGAKDGFTIAIKIIPYLVAMLVGVAVFRASGAMDLLFSGLSHLLQFAGINTDFVPALPTALMKPLSGSGARGLMLDAMKTYGADSFVGRLVCVIQGSADTTFYIAAVYFGSVGIKKTRYAIGCGLFADFVGIIAAIFLAYLFFH